MPYCTPLDTEAEVGLAGHLRIAVYHRHLLEPALTVDRTAEDADQGATDLAQRFVRGERSWVEERASAVPTDPDCFISWFEALAVNGPGQGDPLFPWLATTATREQMVWFLTQELAGEAGFDDLVALTQVKMPLRPKMEMARNLWDEFGRGNPIAVHGTLLRRLADDLGIFTTTGTGLWEPLALSNLMSALALDRHHAYQSVGALGVIEMTAPGRVCQINAGLRRLGLPASTRRYYELHATLDIEHSRAWNNEVLRPLVEADSRIAVLLAEGALMRLEAGRRCFDAYRAHFDLAA